MSFFKVPLATSSSVIPHKNFWNAALLYHDMPHVINRRLGAVTQSFLVQLSLDTSNIERIAEIFTREALLYEIRKLDFTSITSDFIKNIIVAYDKIAQVSDISWKDFRETLTGIYVSVRVLLGRKDNVKCIEVVILDKDKNVVTFFAVQEKDEFSLAPNFPYHIELTSGGQLRIFLDNFEDADTNSADWLADKLFSKLIKWAESDVEDGNILRSLSLVEADQYYLLYNQLKIKYSQDLVKAWPDKTKTNPEKFVHEDLAIAAYLISYWRKFRFNDVTFVDCGCGNGLLVYILNQEGYKGHGVDIRSRKTWEIYEGKADLRVGTITPSSKFPEATWIIGNHSDELTPWIPIIALKSSKLTNYFVLPCCSYDLSGEKYVRTNTKLSQYGDFLNYVQDISERCYFKTEIDKLRIPSTKRTCLIGVAKELEQCDYHKAVIEVLFYSSSRCKPKGYTTRNPVELVRNCTKINKHLIKRLVDLVVRNLLTVPNFIRKKHCPDLWNKGGEMRINQLIEHIPRDDLLEIKNECGGLQTLIKNHRYIFKYENGKVSLREPPVLDENTKKYRDKLCWFARNHPQGCLNSDETCCSKHF